MGRSLGSAVDYGILSRNLQMAENVYMTPNRVFNAAFLGYATRGAKAGKASLDVRVVKGIAPELMPNIVKNLDPLLKALKDGAADAVTNALKSTRDLATKEAANVSKLAGDVWDSQADAALKKQWDDLAKELGTGQSGKELFQEAAGNRARTLVLQESADAFAKDGFTEVAEALGKDIAQETVQEVAVKVGAKTMLFNAAAASKEQFGKLLEATTTPAAKQMYWRGGQLTLIGFGVWQGYKILNAIDNMTNKVGKTLFGESWEQGEGISSIGADNPVLAGTMGWGVVILGVGLLYFLFKPKQAVVVD